MSKMLGMTAKVSFAAFGNKPIEGKIDTGATVSSLHAEDIQMDKGRGTVSFSCPQLSNNRLSLQLDGSQEVHSADAGGVSRPVVTLDVEIDGVQVQNASFNLNDRSQMDSAVLIGQNILKAGDFQIDPNQGEAEPSAAADPQARTEAIMSAVRILEQHDVTLPEIVKYLRTIAINQLED